MTHPRQSLREAVKGMLKTEFAADADPKVSCNFSRTQAADELPAIDIVTPSEYSELDDDDDGYSRDVTLQIMIVDFEDAENVADKLDDYAERIENVLTPGSVAEAKQVVLVDTVFTPFFEGKDALALLIMTYKITITTN